MKEQAQTPPPLPPTQPIKKPNSNAKGRIALLLAFLAICLSILALMVPFFFTEIMKKIKTNTDVSEVTVQRIEPSIEQLRADLNKQKEVVEKLQAQPAAPATPPTVPTNELALAESDYLLTIASYNLMFGKDIDSTIKILETVDQKLQQLNDPTLLPVRQSLTSDIVTLKALPKVDVTGTILRLSAIGDQISSLSSLPAKQFVPAKIPEPGTEQLTFREKVAQSLSKLKDVVVIRRTDEPIKPLLLPEQQFYVQQNILLQINKGQWAVLHQDQAIFQTSLQKTIDLLKINFSQDPKTSNIIKMLTDLKSINVKPTLPDLSKTINLLHRAITASANARQVIPPVTNTNPATPVPIPISTPAGKSTIKSGTTSQKTTSRATR